MTRRICSLLVCSFLLTAGTNAFAEDLPTISQHYLPKILQRANDGLNKASHGDSVNNFFLMFFSWLDDVQATIVGSIDTENRIVLQEQDLAHITPCLHYDLFVLEEKIEEVNDALQLAQEERRAEDIWILKDLLRYLNTRYNNLVLGSTDPTYEDKDIATWRSFDRIGWCCTAPDTAEQCSEQLRTECRNNGGQVFGTVEACGMECQLPDPLPSEPRLCPFDSNYLPPTAEGYGCDLDALSVIPEDTLSLSLRAEKDALQALIEQRDAFKQAVQQMLPVADAITALAGQQPQASNSTPNQTTRTHKRVQNCMEELPEGAARIALRTPFNSARDEIAISRLTQTLLANEAEKREQENSLKYPSEFPEGSPEQEQAKQAEKTLSLLMKALRNLWRIYLTQKSVEQAQKDASPLLQTIDVQQRVSQQFANLRAPMRELTALASKRGKGVRGFVEQYATFLQNSCIYRPCGNALQNILNTVQQDECFPYASGKFTHGWTPEACTATYN